MKAFQMSSLAGYIVFVSGIFGPFNPLAAYEHPRKYLLSQWGSSIITYMCRYEDSDWTMSEVKAAIISDYSAAYEEYLPWSFNRFSGRLYDYNAETNSFRFLSDELFDDGDSKNFYSSFIADGGGKIFIKTVGTSADPVTGAYSIVNFKENTEYDFINGIETVTQLSPTYEQEKSYDCMVWPQPPGAWADG